MKRTRIVALVVGTVGIVWVGVTAQQEMLPRPGPGSGVMNVSVINHPAVTAAQSGEWRVSIGNTPDVRVANAVATHVPPPAFVAANGRYAVTWSGGETETVTIRELAPDGWVRVDHPQRSRWINLRTARAIEEAR